MSLPRAVALTAVFGAAACLSDPVFEPAPSEATTTSSATAPTADGMALIPSTTLSATKTTNDGNGKDDGDDSPPTKPPAPPTPTPPAPTPGPTTTASSTTVASFWLDVHEALNADWDACATAHACPARTCAGASALPVACVTRAEAASLCTWKKKRLPTALEWTAAATGASGRIYPWGNEAPTASRLNAALTALGGPAAPGSFPAGNTPEGVEDLAGNVAEWVSADPAAVRGGSFADTSPSAFTSIASHSTAADSSATTVGFRCARDR